MELVGVSGTAVRQEAASCGCCSALPWGVSEVLGDASVILLIPIILLYHFQIQIRKSSPVGLAPLFEFRCTQNDSCTWKFQTHGYITAARCRQMSHPSAYIMLTEAYKSLGITLWSVVSVANVV